MSKQQRIYELASEYLPGGVCSSARVHKSLGRPLYIARANGSRLFDADGKEYLDLFMSFGAGMLGHGHPAIKEAIARGLEEGFPCAYENEHQARLAKCLAEIVPAIEMVRFTLSGTETTYYAVKTARQYTNRQKVLKFEGHFHGFNDHLAYNYWPQPERMWPELTPATEGLAPELAGNLIVLPFNRPDLLEETITARGHEIAAVILEPLNYNSGTIEPLRGYLEKLRALTTQHGIVLIFDEILSSFRTGPGCIQDYYGVTPDLCTLGKTLGGGLALSAFGGSREIMSRVAPLDTIQHSGTFNALWLPIMAGEAFVDTITHAGFYPTLLARSQRLYDGINEIMRRRGYLGRVRGIGARCSFIFGPLAEQDEMINYADFVKNDWNMGLSFYGAALQNGLYMHSAHHHGISAMHSDADIDLALERIDRVVAGLQRSGLGRPQMAAGLSSFF